MNSWIQKECIGSVRSQQWQKIRIVDRYKYLYKYQQFVGAAALCEITDIRILRIYIMRTDRIIDI